VALANQQAEMHGFPKTSFYQMDQEFVPRIVQIALTPSPTPVSQPLWATGAFNTKHGRSVRVSAEHQVLFNQLRRMVLHSRSRGHHLFLTLAPLNTQHDTQQAQWGIVQVGSIEMGLDSTPFTRPSPSDITHALESRREMDALLMG